MRESAKSMRLRATRAEQRICEALGAVATYNSGAGTTKGDGRRFGEYRIEAKSTTTGKYRLTGVDWHKLAHNCIASGEMPIFSIDYERHGLHLIVVSAGSFSNTFDYEHVPVRKGCQLPCQGWQGPYGEDEIEHRLMALTHARNTYYLVALHASDFLRQIRG